MLLGPAGAAIIAVTGAERALAGDAVISGEASAGAGLAVAGALVGAFRPRMEVIGIYDGADPSVIAGASAKGAIGTGPFWLATQAGEAQAIVVALARAVV